MAIARVAERVQNGGHYVADDVIKRRYHRGLTNLFNLYLPLANQWRIYDNSNVEGTKLIAKGSFNNSKLIDNPEIWEPLKVKYADE